MVKGGVILDYIIFRGVIETPLNIMQSITTATTTITSVLKHIIKLTPL